MEYPEDLLNKVLDKLNASTRSPRGEYSKEETYPILKKRLFGHRRIIIMRRIVATAAVIALLCIPAWWGYQYYENTLTTTVYAQADIKRLTLPDGSKIVLNRHSQITYQKDFNSRRSVILEGEAYFEVRHDSQRPFSVTTSTITVNDLGTRFNINGYRRSPIIKATLLEGAIDVRNNINQSRLVLKPGQTAIYNKGRKLLSMLPTPDSDNTTAWQSGAIIFNDCPIGEVALQLSNTFNTPITVKGDKLKSYRINARFTHGESLKAILTVLQRAGYFDYTKANKGITLYKE